MSINKPIQGKESLSDAEKQEMSSVLNEIEKRLSPWKDIHMVMENPMPQHLEVFRMVQSLMTIMRDARIKEETVTKLWEGAFKDILDAAETRNVKQFVTSINALLVGIKLVRSTVSVPPPEKTPKVSVPTKPIMQDTRSALEPALEPENPDIPSLPDLSNEDLYAPVPDLSPVLEEPSLIPESIHADDSKHAADLPEDKPSKGKIEEIDINRILAELDSDAKEMLYGFSRDDISHKEFVKMLNEACARIEANISLLSKSKKLTPEFENTVTTLIRQYGTFKKQFDTHINDKTLLLNDTEKFLVPLNQFLLESDACYRSSSLSQDNSYF